MVTDRGELSLHPTRLLMHFLRPRCLIAWLLLIAPAVGDAQPSLGYQADFSREELAARRARVLDAIGTQGVAVVRGATGEDGFSVFRQSNELYYLSGVESPHAYLLLNGRTRRSTLYLLRRDEERERGEGKVLSVEDSVVLVQLHKSTPPPSGPGANRQ